MSSSKFCSWHRVPRARIDPIDTPDDALAVISLAASRPPVDEVLIVLLDDTRCGLSLIAVDGTDDDDAVVRVIEWLADASEQLDDVEAIVVASVRPSRPVDDADIETWLEASQLADDCGIELVEWFVVSGDGPTRRIGCPRDLLGQSPRW